MSRSTNGQTIWTNFTYWPGKLEMLLLTQPSGGNSRPCLRHVNIKSQEMVLHALQKVYNLVELLTYRLKYLLTLHGEVTACLGEPRALVISL